MRFSYLPCALPFALAATILAQNPQTQVQDTAQDPAVAALEKRTEELEKELSSLRTSGLRAINVNGQTLSPLHVWRELIHLIGIRQVTQRIDDLFVEEWKDEAVRGGRDPKEFELDEAQVAEKLGKDLKEFRLKNPGVPFWEAVRSMTGMTKEAYLSQYRQTEVFNKVFFPGPAKNWPDITREAIMASAADGNGQQFWDNIEKTSVDEQGNARELPAFWMMLCRQWVTKQLKKWSEIRYPSDGLPPDVALSVNGVNWPTSEAFETVRAGLFQQDVERATLEVVVREAMRQELAAKNCWLTDEEFRKEFDEYRQEYDNTPFTTEVIAVNFKGYPSLEAFRQRWRLIRSFERLIAKDINDDNLQAHAEQFKSFFGEGSVSVDAIQFYARDLKTGAWLPNGMAKARERAQAAFDAIKGGAKFDDVHGQMGEYYTTDTDKGRFNAKPYNQLRQLMRENEFTDVLIGVSPAHYAYYDAPIGQVVGPLPGPDAYWVIRVNARTPSRAAPSVTDPRTRELVKQDYVAYRFMQWANGVVAKAKIE
jgi:hypothetical protein